MRHHYPFAVGLPQMAPAFAEIQLLLVPTYLDPCFCLPFALMHVGIVTKQPYVTKNR